MTKFLTLNKKGILLALLTGALVFTLGDGHRLLFLSDLVLFLALSAVITSFGRIKKQGLGVYDRARGWQNVLANGAVPVMAAGLYWVSLGTAFLPPAVLALAYIASVCAVMADKFASEIGVLDGEPTILLTFKKAKKGASGGVTSVGLLASLVGSSIIGASAFALGVPVAYVIAVVFSGFFGNIIDSVFGYYEEKGYGNKHTSNFFCSLAGFLMCILILTAL
ncbi:Uncharacterised protein [uncultured archaeon]|nr:Uncharacterised protein [uncultured archaeon]